MKKYIILGFDMENVSASPVKRNTKTGVPYEGVVKVGHNLLSFYMPANYTPDKEYPIIILLYGKDSDITSHNFLGEEYDLFKSIAQQREYILAVPDYGSDSWMNKAGEKIVLESIDFIKQKLSIDEKRFYLLGVSMGGGSALTFTVKHHEMITAVCDVMGVTDFIRFYNEGPYHDSIGGAFGGSPEKKPEFYQEQSSLYHANVLKNIPTLIIHGDKDQTVPIWNSELLYEKLIEYQATVEFIKVAGATHHNSIVLGLERQIFDFFDTWTK